MPLRLKQLELHGYKTFATKTDFIFSDGISAIVGPNGSGKSNVVDSIRWVLGEQAFGLLRGKKTEDMIFAGSELRPRAGMAEANLVFDNSDGWLPIDFAEVSITRRAYRDGENEYLLNGQRVRLRDISELLAKCGRAERTYSIIRPGAGACTAWPRPPCPRFSRHGTAPTGTARSRPWRRPGRWPSRPPPNSKR